MHNYSLAEYMRHIEAGRCPLLIDDDVSPLPTLDSTRILARAALREANQSDRDG